MHFYVTFAEIQKALKKKVTGISKEENASQACIMTIYVSSI
jgi:hypothetical protein